MSSEIPQAYLSDPDEYLRSPKFHLTHTFTPTLLSSPLTVSYALCGSTDPSHPVLVWINGLGHHRISSVLFDGICRDKNVRLLTFDRPSAGQSTPLPPAPSSPLNQRVEIVSESLVSILDKHGITNFSLLSHSNGIIYSLHFLLHLSSSSSSSSSHHLTCHNWFLTSPWILPSLSGSWSLSLASRLVPRRLTAKLGGLAQGVMSIVNGPVGTSFGVAREWVGTTITTTSSAAAWSSSGFVSPATTTTASIQRNEHDDGEEEEEETTTTKKKVARGDTTVETGSSNQRRRKKTPRDEIESFETLQSLKPVKERSFGGRYYPPGTLDRGLEIAVKEGLEGMGVEAVMSLKGTGIDWGWVKGESDDGGIKDEELYERGFESLKDRIHEEGWDLTVRVWCAGDDGMIPKQGREWFRRLLVEQLNLVERDDWTEVDKAGHDEVLAREYVVNEILSKTKRN